MFKLLHDPARFGEWMAVEGPAPEEAAAHLGAERELVARSLRALATLAAA